MRLRFWRHDDIEGGLDPELQSLFARTAPTPGAPEMARGRARVAHQLAGHAPATRRRLARRLALGTVGGGGLWAAFLGTASAHKVAAAAVGLSVLLAGGAATVEVTGVGPSMIEALGALRIDLPAALDRGRPNGTANEVGVENPGRGNNVETGDAGDQPGQFVTQLHASGSFQLRGQLVSVLGATITVSTTSGNLDLDVTGAEIRLPGGGQADGDEELADFADHLIFITGSCEPGDQLVTGSCTVERVTILGQAGQGAPDASGRPEDAGNEKDSGNDKDADEDKSNGKDKANDKDSSKAGHGEPATRA